MKQIGHIDYQILLADAGRGIRYASFEDYYARRLRNRAIFIDENAKGALAAVRDAVRANVRACWAAFAKDHPDLIAAPAIADGCGGLPQAGEHRNFPSPGDPA